MEKVEYLKHLEKLVKYYPYETWLSLELGHYYFSNEKYKDAVRTYRNVTLYDPDFAAAFCYLGRAQYYSCEDINIGVGSHFSYVHLEAMCESLE